jgi:hypothetical protein
MEIKKRLVQLGDDKKIQSIDFTLSELKIIQNRLIEFQSDSVKIEHLRKKLEYFISNIES